MLNLFICFHYYLETVMHSFNVGSLADDLKKSSLIWVGIFPGE